jgi:hypothetical protein
MLVETPLGAVRRDTVADAGLTRPPGPTAVVAPPAASIDCSDGREATAEDPPLCPAGEAIATSGLDTADEGRCCCGRGWDDDDACGAFVPAGCCFCCCCTSGVYRRPIFEVVNINMDMSG